MNVVCVWEVDVRGKYVERTIWEGRCMGGVCTGGWGGWLGVGWKRGKKVCVEVCRKNYWIWVCEWGEYVCVSENSMSKNEGEKYKKTPPKDHYTVCCYIRPKMYKWFDVKLWSGILRGRIKEDDQVSCTPTGRLKPKQEGKYIQFSSIQKSRFEVPECPHPG